MVYFDSLYSIQSALVHFGPIQFTTVQLGPFNPVQSIQSVYSGLFSLVWSIHLTSVYFSPIWSIRFCSILVNSLRSIPSNLVHLVHFGLLRLVWCNSVYCGLIGPFNPHFCLFGAFNPFRSISVLSYFIQFGLFYPLRSIWYNPFRFTLVNFVYLLENEKRQV